MKLSRAGVIAACIGAGGVLGAFACDSGPAPGERPPTTADAPPPASDGTSSSSTALTGATGATGKAAGPMKPYHTMTIVLCARDPSGCPASGAGDAPPDGTATTYRVAFGSGAGAMRTREQAMADLYKELRDRMAYGTHLAAQSHHLDLPGDAAVTSATEHRAPGGSNADPLVTASFDLMTLVDVEGEVTLDSASRYGTCKLSLGTIDADGGGGGRCFFSEEKPEAHGGGGGRR